MIKEIEHKKYIAFYIIYIFSWFSFLIMVDKLLSSNLFLMKYNNLIYQDNLILQLQKGLWKNYLIAIFFMPPHLFFLMEMFCGNAFCTNRRPFLYHLVCFHFVWGRHLFALPPPTESWQLRRTLWPSRNLTRFCTWLTPGAK